MGKIDEIPAVESVAADKRKTIRVLIADDHAVVRQGLVRLLRDEPDIEVVGEAINGEMAVELSRKLCPDVVIMDVNMPDSNGFDATRKISNETPSTKVIALTVYKSPQMESLLREAGAAAYLIKDEPFTDLLVAIRSCIKGGDRSGPML